MGQAIAIATPRVKVDPEVIRWAVGYSRREAYLREEYKDRDKIAAWETGEQQPTYAQLREFAKATRVPEGYLYGSRIPDMSLGVPEMRTVGDVEPSDPSPDLVDTVYTCKRRQSWYVGYAERHGLVELDFVGSLSRTATPGYAAAAIGERIGFGVSERDRVAPDAYRKLLADRADGAGILVMINGVVGNNTRRPLDPEEFRGFSLVDRLAPLVFVNGRDSLGAQVFTLAHELAHIWLGESGVSAPDYWSEPHHPVERWCNAVAAEFLVPGAELRRVVGRHEPIAYLPMLQRHLKVSNLVLLRRLRDVGLLDPHGFTERYRRELQQSRSRVAARGGNHWVNAANRVSPRFARALYGDLQHGGTSRRDAYRLSGVSSATQLERLAAETGGLS